MKSTKGPPLINRESVLAMLEREEDQGLPARKRLMTQMFEIERKTLLSASVKAFLNSRIRTQSAVKNRSCSHVGLQLVA